MKKFKFSHLLLAIVGVLAFASCQHEHADWTPGVQDASMGVYFPDTSHVDLAVDGTEAEIVVKRFKTAEAASVKVRIEDIDKCGLFTVQGTEFDDEGGAIVNVDFAAGAEESFIIFGYDSSDLVAGAIYSFSIQLDQADASLYGVSNTVFTLAIPEPWKSLGKGTYRDDFLAPLYGGPSGVIVEVEVVQHELEPNRYRMVEPYSQAMCPYIIGGVPEDMTYTGPGYVEFVVDENGNVVIPSSPLGFKLDVGTGGPVDFYLATVYADENTPLYGKFEEGVFWFTTPQSIMWHIPDGRGNYANQNGLFALALPGYSIRDYSISAAYAGMVTESDNVTTSALLEFAVGSDVQSYKFTILDGNVVDATETIAAIVEGSEDITIYEAEADELAWTLDLGAAGIYTVVAVPYADEAVVDEAIVYPFYFHMGGGELPKAEFKVLYDSVFNLTGDEKYEEQFPEAYFVALGIIGNPNEMKSIKAWIGDAAVVAGSGMTPEQLVAGYGEDFQSAIDAIRKSYDPEKGYGSAVMGPYNMASGSTSCAIVAIETLYGDTQVFYVEKELPNATGFALGSYSLSDTLNGKEYALDFHLGGGYEPNQLLATIKDFQFVGKVDAENSAVVFDGFEWNYEEDLITNTYTFYYDKAQTQAFGYYAASDAELNTPADLTFSFEGDKLVGLETYFASLIFALEDESLVGYDFYFSPEATLEYTEGAAEPETSAVKASVKSLGAELQLGVAVDFTVSTIKAEPYHGEVVREYVSNATFAF